MPHCMLNTIQYQTNHESRIEELNMNILSRTIAILLAFSLLPTLLAHAAPLPTRIVAGTGSPGSENGMAVAFHMRMIFWCS